MRNRLILIGALGALLCAAPADAATVSFEFNRSDPGDGRGSPRIDYYDFRFEAGPGEANRVTIRGAPGSVRVRDDGAPLAAGANCQKDGAEVVCSAGTPLGSDVKLGDGDDTLMLESFFATVDDGAGDDDTVASGFNVRVLGAPGADSMRAGKPESTLDYRRRGAGVRVTPDGVANDGALGEGDDVGPGFTYVYGGDGDDELHGGDGAPQGVVEGGAGDDRTFGGLSFNRLVGGDGDDELYGNAYFDELLPGSGGDLVRGGEGRDVMSYPGETRPMVITLDDARGDGPSGENDDLGSDLEVVVGGAGDDVLVGSDIPNELSGGPDGTDVLDGRGGADVLVAGRGRIIGGAGPDTISSGERIELDLADGERDSVECGRSARLLTFDPFDSLTACVPKLSGPPARKRLRARRDGTVLVGFRCDREADVPCAGRLHARLGRDLSEPVVGRGRFRLIAGERRNVALRLTSGLRKQLARRGTVPIAITATAVRDVPASRRATTFDVVLLRAR